jgi:hypothetical protein
MEKGDQREPGCKMKELLTRRDFEDEQNDY